MFSSLGISRVSPPFVTRNYRINAIAAHGRDLCQIVYFANGDWLYTHYGRIVRL